LEPVVCRRVVGRLPSPSLERTGWHCSQSLRREVAGSLSCEIARIFTRDFHLTTGTFNLVVKEPIRFHRGGRFQFRAETHECDSACPRNLYKLLVLLGLVNLGYSQVLHRKLSAISRQLSAGTHAQQNSSSGRFKMPDFGTSRHGRCLVKLKILKEVLATYAQTLRGTLSPNMTPWPGRNCLLQIRCRTSVERLG
jgi:hypothetical protein